LHRHAHGHGNSIFDRASNYTGRLLNLFLQFTIQKRLWRPSWLSPAGRKKEVIVGGVGKVMVAAPSDSGGGREDDEKADDAPDTEGTVRTPSKTGIVYFAAPGQKSLIIWYR
jgi:hypothetical protein